MCNSPEQPDFLKSLDEHKKNSGLYALCNEDEVSVKVSSNLFMRHKQLYWLEGLTREHAVHHVLVSEYNKAGESSQGGGTPYFNYYSSKFGKQHDPIQKLLPEERVYRLAATDLFVEKAQAFLEERAESYQRSGKRAHRIACFTIFIGAIFACQQMVSLHGTFARSWLELTTTFTRAFTAYGMIVLAAVGLWRYGKAMLDQSERLYERRHALRQGRLFVHLNDGKLTIDEMEKAFKWNESQENAFANIHTEASAPWGAFAKEFFKNLPEIYKAGVQSMSKGKSEDK